VERKTCGKHVVWKTRGCPLGVEDHPDLISSGCPVRNNAPLEFLTGQALEARKKNLVTVRNHHFEDGLDSGIVIVAESG